MQEEVKGFFSSLNACLSLVVKKKTLAEVMVLHYLRWKRLSVVARCFMGGRRTLRLSSLEGERSWKSLLDGEVLSQSKVQCYLVA